MVIQIYKESILKNPKLNIIKLNFIVAILNSIFILCVPIGKVNPKPHINTNPENNQN
ncbi:complement regulator acquiring protein 1 (plasmid) [Borreliella garinii PBr]|uniref:Complement regulator acquiring protein 1 n=1 Tax=Borreliella garinii PBr TaxID=498743 RepID=B8F198_BORGR|nr:complement regulator acquiring protein 1 [Borreliella garinii PBr]